MNNIDLPEDNGENHHPNKCQRDLNLRDDKLTDQPLRDDSNNLEKVGFNWNSTNKIYQCFYSIKLF